VTSRKRPSLLEETYFEQPPRYNADENDVEIADRQQIGLAGHEPIGRRRALTLWAMAVATGVISDTGVAAILAPFDMATERG